MEGLGLDRHRQAPVVHIAGKLNQRILDGGFAKVHVRCRSVGLVASRLSRVSRATEGHVVATQIGSIERAIVDVSGLHLFGVRHGTGKGSRKPLAQRLIEVVLHGLFGNSESQGHGFVVVTRNPTLAGRVVLDRRAFSLSRGRSESGEENLFLERPVGRFRVEENSVLVVVTLVLKPENGIETRLKLLKNL